MICSKILTSKAYDYNIDFLKKIFDYDYFIPGYKFDIIVVIGKL